jgi:hypothetical protein
MSIILLESPDSCHTAERTAGLVSVKNPKVRHADGQLLVTPFLYDIRKAS